MKKLFMFLAVAGLATFGASCSKSDDGTPPVEEKQLVASADKSTIEVGGSVTFTAKVDGKVETEVEFYEGTTKLGNPHKFDKKGEFSIVAKKKGFKDSSAIKITVNEKGTETKKLSLIAPSSVKVGETVSFVVREGSNIITDAVIKMNGTTIVTNPWKATAEGTYKFVASKEGFTNSDEVTVVVTVPSATFENFVSLDGVQRELSYGIFGVDAYKDKDANGKDIWVPILYALNDGSGDVAVFTIQVFKGKDADADYKAAFKQGGTVYGVTILIRNVKGQPLQTPANTPVADWLYGGGLLTLVNGDTQYMTPDSNTRFSWAGQADAKGMQFAMNIEGGSFTEVMTAAGKTAKSTTLDVDFQVVTQGLFYFEEEKPTSRQSFTVKGLSGRSLKVKKLIK